MCTLSVCTLSLTKEEPVSRLGESLDRVEWLHCTALYCVVMHCTFAKFSQDFYRSIEFQNECLMR